MALRQYQFDAIGTHWHIEFEPALGTDADAIVALVREHIAAFDKHYSRFRKDSLVTEISQKAGVYPLPEDAEPMLTLYRDLYRLTDGAFTPLIGKTLEEAGYDAEYSLTPKPLTKLPSLDEAVSFDAATLTAHQPVLLDFGAAGKGYLIDIVAALLREQGATSYVVDAGGDIAVWNKEGEPVRIGLENPENTKEVIGVATLINQSICGSAGNRRAWGEFHHIINPHTLSSPRDILAVWAVAETTLLADALTTCLYFVAPSVLAPHYDFEYLIMRPDSSVEHSKHFPAELFSN